MTDIIALSLGSALALGLFISAVLSMAEFGRCLYVRRNSEALLRLKALNKATHERFSPYWNRTITAEVSLRSKRSFDQKSMSRCLWTYLEANIEQLSPIYEALQQDRKLYRIYTGAADQLRHLYFRRSQQDSISMPKDKFDTYEANLFSGSLLSPPGFRILVKKTYTSPKRHHNYVRTRYFCANDFIATYRAVTGIRSHGILKREKIPDSLRYKVLMRDGACCQLCGRSQRDGAILHIDHIKPVAKGGTNDIDNLRTLCRECNLGKSDSYNPCGIN